MAHYIMRRFSDKMNGEGERLFPKLVGAQTYDLENVAKMIEDATAFTSSDVCGVLNAFAHEIKKRMTAGDSVKIAGLGTFFPVLGLVEKDERGDWHDKTGRTTTGRNVKLKTINFRPDTSLTRSVQQNMKLDKLDDSAVAGHSAITSTLAERTASAKEYLSAHGYMRIKDYASLTHLSYATAATELRAIAADPASGIISQGVRAGKVYVLK